MRTAAIRIAAAGVNSVGSGQFKGNSGAEKMMNNLMINYAGSHNMTLGQMTSMQNEISQFYQGLVLVRGWDKGTYEGLYNKVIKNVKLNHEGVQYGTVQAIREADNNWGVMAMSGEAAAMIAAEGLFPVNAGKGPKPPHSSAAYYDDILSASFTIKNLESFRGARPSTVANWLEKNGWVGVPTNKNRVYTDGMRYTNGAKFEQIRIMSGGVKRSVPGKQGPYMEVSMKGKKTVIPLMGNPKLYEK
jgi:hypothetical protein